MSGIKFTQQMKMHIVIVALKVQYSVSEIVCFWKLSNLSLSMFKKNWKMRTSSTSYMLCGYVSSCRKRQERMIDPCKVLSVQAKTSRSWDALVFLWCENLWSISNGKPKEQLNVIQKPDWNSKNHVYQISSNSDVSGRAMREISCLITSSLKA